MCGAPTACRALWENLLRGDYHPAFTQGDKLETFRNLPKATQPTRNHSGNRHPCSGYVERESCSCAPSPLPGHAHRRHREWPSHGSEAPQPRLHRSPGMSCKVLGQRLGSPAFGRGLEGFTEKPFRESRGWQPRLLPGNELTLAFQTQEREEIGNTVQTWPAL